jgi:hypothetical protein
MHPLRVELLRRVIPRFQRRQQVETTVTALRVVDHPSLTTTASSTSSLRSFRLLSHRWQKLTRLRCSKHPQQTKDSRMGMEGYGFPIRWWKSLIPVEGLVSVLMSTVKRSWYRFRPMLERRSLSMWTFRLVEQNRRDHRQPSSSIYSWHAVAGRCTERSCSAAQKALSWRRWWQRRRSWEVVLSVVENYRRQLRY